jgi:hypothetical protein
MMGSFGSAVAAIAGVASLASCATIIEDTDQRVPVVAQLAGASCTLSRSGDPLATV